jgi:hypothetical protein
MYSFDTKTLPNNYEEVGTKLFLSGESKQPLGVGLGGVVVFWTRHFNKLSSMRHK